MNREDWSYFIQKINTPTVACMHHKTTIRKMDGKEKQEDGVDGWKPYHRMGNQLLKKVRNKSCCLPRDYIQEPTT